MLGRKEAREAELATSRSKLPRVARFWDHGSGREIVGWRAESGVEAGHRHRVQQPGRWHARVRASQCRGSNVVEGRSGERGLLSRMENSRDSSSVKVSRRGRKSVEKRSRKTGSKIGSTRNSNRWIFTEFRLNFSLATWGISGKRRRMSHARFRSNRDLIYADELALIGDDDNQVSDSGIGGIRKRSRESYRSVVQLRTRFERSFFLFRIYLLGGKGKFVVSTRDWTRGIRYKILIATETCKIVRYARCFKIFLG